MAKGKGGGAPAPQKSTTDRKNGKASKKRPKMFDAEKRRLVTKKQCSGTLVLYRLVEVTLVALGEPNGKPTKKIEDYPSLG